MVNKSHTVTADDDYYENTVSKFKNKKSISLILVAVAVIGGGIGLINSVLDVGDRIIPTEETIGVDYRLHSYTIRNEISQSATHFELIEGSFEKIDEIAEEITNKIVSSIEPETRSSSTNLVISGNYLESTEFIRAEMIYSIPLDGSNMMIQRAATVDEIKEHEGKNLNLDEWFTEPYTDNCNPANDLFEEITPESCIEISFDGVKGGTQGKLLKIFKSGNEYYFAGQSKIMHVTFDGRDFRILIDDFEISGDDPNRAKVIHDCLKSKTRQLLEKEEHIKIVDWTYEETLERGEEINRLNSSSGKSGEINRETIDFILRGSIMVTT